MKSAIFGAKLLSDRPPGRIGTIVAFRLFDGRRPTNWQPQAERRDLRAYCNLLELLIWKRTQLGKKRCSRPVRASGARNFLPDLDLPCVAWAAGVEFRR